MELRDLEQFLAVLEHGSILAAAEAVGVTQPALSRRMRALEKDLGVPLLNRSSRGVQPTVYGSLLQRHARLVLRDRQHAIEALRALRDGIVGHARIGIAPAFSGMLPAALEGLAAHHTGLSFSVVQGTYDTLIASLREGDIDGAFTLLVPGASLDGLHAQAIADTEVRILCATDHPLARKRKLDLADLAAQEWVIMNRPRALAEMFRAIAASQGLDAPQIAVETDSLDLVKSLVLAGRYLSPLPATAMWRELQERSATSLPIDGLPVFSLGFVHRQEVIPPAVELLLEEVRARMAERGR